MTVPTEGERAAFEAGIKFGALYHQFAGAPVSPDSADSLASAMEASIENQPFCVDVSVTVDEERVRAAIDGPERSAAVEERVDETDGARAGGTDEPEEDGSDGDESKEDGSDGDEPKEGGADGGEPEEADGSGASDERPEVHAAAGDVADYVELTGTLFDATVTVRRRGHEVVAAMETHEDYPQMELRDVRRPE